MIDRDHFDRDPPNVEDVRSILRSLELSSMGSTAVARHLFGGSSDGRRVRAWLQGDRSPGYFEWTALVWLARDRAERAGQGGSDAKAS